MTTDRLWVPPPARAALTRIVTTLREVADIVDAYRHPDQADDIYLACNEIEKIIKGGR